MGGTLGSLGLLIIVGEFDRGVVVRHQNAITLRNELVLPKV